MEGPLVAYPTPIVIAGLDPAIHLPKMMDARVKPAHDKGTDATIAHLDDDLSDKTQMPRRQRQDEKGGWMMIEWFEDLSLGMRFKSETVQISEDDIKQFAAKFDPQPFHLDDEAARETIFKGLAASGWHTAAIAMSLCVKARPFGPHPLIGLGVDGLRWMLPFILTDTS